MSKNREPSWLRDLRLTAHDMTGQEVADYLGIHYSVVCRNLKRARDKMGTKTTVAAVYKAVKSGLIVWTFAILPVNDSFESHTATPGAFGQSGYSVDIVRLRNGRVRSRSGRNSRRLD